MRKTFVFLKKRVFLPKSRFGLVKKCLNSFSNKKVLLRERKRHTARRVAIATPSYSGGEGSLDKNFFSSLNMYQSKSGVKKFSLYHGGSLYKKKIFQSEHISIQIWCQKFFPLLVGEGGGVPRRKFFFPVWTCIKPNLVSKIFPFTGGGGGVPWQKNFFPVWTCIKPNLVSKIFPFTGGGGSLNKKFFFQSEHVSIQIWCQKVFPLPWGGVPRQKFFFLVWTCIKPNLVSKIFPFTGGGGVPWQKNFFPVWTCTNPNLVSKSFPLPLGVPLQKKIFQSEHISIQIWCQKVFPLPWGVPLQKKIFQSEHVSSQIWCQKFFPLPWGGSLNQKLFFQSEHVSSQIWCQNFFPLPWMGGSLDKNFFFQSEHVSSQIYCQKFFPLLRLGTPPPHPRLDWPPPVQDWIGTPSPPVQGWRLDWDPPSKAEGWIGTPPPEMLTDRHLWKQYLPVILRMRAVNIQINTELFLHGQELSNGGSNFAHLAQCCNIIYRNKNFSWSEHNSMK